MRDATTARADYGFGPAVRLRVSGSRRAIAHFDREFGPPLAPGPAPHAEVAVWFGRPGGRAHDGASGGYKSIRWRVELSSPAHLPLRARIRLSGGPPSFALSLVQGWFVEPVVAMALAREGYLALPSAGLAIDGGALLLVGPSRSGKSSVSMRALAQGHSLLGDDQVLVDREGGCRPYPRRLRVYPDIREVAPGAWLRLSASTRRVLTARRIVRDLTRGFVAPSLALPMTEIGPAPPPDPLPLRRLLVIERSVVARELESLPRDSVWAADRARGILADQRGRLAAIAGESWRTALSEIAAREVEIFRSAAAAAQVEQVLVPAAWGAERAVSALARQAGL